MIILKALVTAGPNHPTYPTGLEVQASVFVDSDDWPGAEALAATKLRELGWYSLNIKESVRLPTRPDLSSFTPQLHEAFNLAKNLGIALVVYPPRAT
jgi:hypothetical protein